MTSQSDDSSCGRNTRRQQQGHGTRQYQQLWQLGQHGAVGQGSTERSRGSSADPWGKTGHSPACAPILRELSGPTKIPTSSEMS